MGDRPGGGLGHHGGEAGASALGDHHAVGAGALGGADDCPQVVGVGELVTDHDEGLLPLVPGDLEDVLHRDVLPDGGHGDDPLVGVGAAHLIQLVLVGVGHHDALLPGGGGDVAQGGIHLALHNKDLVDVGPGPEGFDDRVAALDDAVGLLVGLAGGTGITAFFFHNTPILAENRPKEEI